MLEYLNYGALGVLGFLLFAGLLLDSGMKKKSIGLHTLILICIGLIFFSAFHEKSTAQKNINDFKNKNATLKCMSGGGLYVSADTYRVSLDDGWQVDKNHFIKESFVIGANKCERW
jgi:uncharacterized membrane protein YhiD involved in acid resistance